MKTLATNATLAGTLLLAATGAASADYVLYKDPAYPSMLYVDAGPPKKKQIAMVSPSQQGGQPIDVIEAPKEVPVEEAAQPAAEKPQTLEERAQERLDAIESGDTSAVEDAVITRQLLPTAELR